MHCRLLRYPFVSVHGQRKYTTELNSNRNKMMNSIYNNKTNSFPLRDETIPYIYLSKQSDFFAIQKGDHFTVIYDEDFVNGESIGLGKIYSASFSCKWFPEQPTYLRSLSFT